jgi:hypothetical protein
MVKEASPGEMSTSTSTKVPSSPTTAQLCTFASITYPNKHHNLGLLSCQRKLSELKIFATGDRPESLTEKGNKLSLCLPLRAFSTSEPKQALKIYRARIKINQAFKDLKSLLF